VFPEAWDADAEPFLSYERSGDASAAVASELLERTGGAPALVATCLSGGGARSMSAIAGEMFPSLEEGERLSALSGLMRAISDAHLSEPPRIRAHLFFKTVSGLWACSRPDCD